MCHSGSFLLYLELNGVICTANVIVYQFNLHVLHPFTYNMLYAMATSELYIILYIMYQQHLQPKILYMHLEWPSKMLQAAYVYIVCAYCYTHLLFQG